MYSSIADYLTKFLLKNKYIDQENYQIHQFGMEKFVSEIIGNIILFLLALLLDTILEGLIFYYIFKFMRKYAGGYHATTYLICNLIYLSTFTITVFISKNIENIYISIIFNILAFLLVIFLSPIENPNNPITKGNHIKYYIYSIVSVLIISLINILCMFFSIHIHSLISTTMLASTIFMCIEIIRREENPLKSFKEKVCEIMAKISEKNAINTTREVSINRLHQPKAPEKLIEFSEKKRG